MNTQQTKNKEIRSWRADDVTRTRTKNGIAYHDAHGNELMINREQIDFETAIVFERLREMITLLNKAKALNDVQETILLKLLDDGEKTIIAHYATIRKHIGPVYLERSGDEVIGCALETAQHNA